MGGTKLERFLPKNHHTQRKLLNFGFVAFLSTCILYSLQQSVSFVQKFPLGMLILRQKSF